MNGEFPNWQSIMPRDKRTDVKVKVADLSLSLERCNLLTDEKSGAVDLIFAGQELTIHAANSLHGEADEVVPYEGTFKDELKNTGQTRISSARWRRN